MCVEGFRVQEEGEVLAGVSWRAPRGVHALTSSCAARGADGDSAQTQTPIASGGCRTRRSLREEYARVRPNPAGPMRHSAVQSHSALPPTLIDLAAMAADAGHHADAMQHRHANGIPEDDVAVLATKSSSTQPSAADIAMARSRLAHRLAGLGANPRIPPSVVPSAVPSATVPVEDLDVLARATASFRVLLQRAGHLVEACQRSPYYSALSRTTQPAHIVTFLSVAVLAAVVFPRHAAGSTKDSAQAPSSWTYLTYVVAFAAHFGSQFWMTFVSGLSLFFSLPRHHFAEVQKVLFPLYFGINAALSLVTLATFVRITGLASHWARWDAEMCVQVGGMVLCFLLELLVRLYLTPPLLQLITVKTEMEKTVQGVGQEVGRHDLGPLTQCPHYVKIHRAFRKVHGSIALANIAAMGCTALHAHYLAGKICV